MIEAVLAVPGDLAAPTGGYAYARALLRHAPAHGVRLSLLALPGSFPDPSEADLAETARLLAVAPPGAVLLVDGLAYGALPAGLVAGLAPRPVAALVHHPLGYESGLAQARRAALIASERAALKLARAVVATSPFTARLLVEAFGVPPDTITVALPGTEPAPRARGTGSPVALLAVGAVSPRKGYRVLVEALAGLGHLDWRLTLAGALDRDPAEAEGLRGAIGAAGLEGRIRLAGAVTQLELDALYDAADVLVSPSLFEGYGMALTEALARGLPLVASTGGAAAETAPDGAALKVPPGNAGALAGALRRVVGDPALRAALAERAHAAGRALPRWSDAAARVADALRRIGA